MIYYIEFRKIRPPQRRWDVSMVIASVNEFPNHSRAEKYMSRMKNAVFARASFDQYRRVKEMLDKKAAIH